MFSYLNVFMTEKKIKCDRCNKKAVISLKYGPHYFCGTHFTNFFETRIKRTIRKYKLFKSKEKLLVALSGGKDSTVILNLLHKFYSKSNPLEAIIIDEGVKGYREKAIETAVKNCKKLGIKYTIISFKNEFDIDNDEMMPLILNNRKLGGTCAFCGTLRRTIMNKYAKKLNADKLVTGHNLDDEVQSIVMNIFNNDYEKFLRQNAGTGDSSAEGFVKRIKPLFETPEKEIIAYCNYKKIQNYSDECCPYSWTAKRNEYREMLNTFETRFPGTEFSIMRFFETIKKEIPEKPLAKIRIKKCAQCGEPTENEKCMACNLVEKILKEKTNNVDEKKINKKMNQAKHKKYDKSKTCNTTKRK
jgi:uncharacterized protein (TIGR00269 family)